MINQFWIIMKVINSVSYFAKSRQAGKNLYLKKMYSKSVWMSFTNKIETKFIRLILIFINGYIVAAIISGIYIINTPFNQEHVQSWKIQYHRAMLNSIGYQPMKKITPLNQIFTCLFAGFGSKVSQSIPAMVLRDSAEVQKLESK